MKKSQAALEFLMTYGWAFLILVVIIAGFTYLGVLRPDQYVAERCIASTGFNCEEHRLEERGDNFVITTTIRNFVGASINLTSNPEVKSDICPNGICSVVSTDPNLESGVEIPANGEVAIETEISVPNGMASGEKHQFEFEIDYLEARKDFPKEMELEVFAELN